MEWIESFFSFFLCVCVGCRGSGGGGGGVGGPLEKRNTINASSLSWMQVLPSISFVLQRSLQPVRGGGQEYSTGVAVV